MQQAPAILDNEQHSISYTLSRNQAVIVEYSHDDASDLFQVLIKKSSTAFSSCLDWEEPMKSSRNSLLFLHFRLAEALNRQLILWLWIRSREIELLIR